MKYIGYLLLLLSGLATAQVPEHDIKINVVMTGAHSVPANVRSNIAAEIRRTTTEPGQIPDEMVERIRDQFQQYGYFKAEVKGTQIKYVRDKDGYVTSIEARVAIDAGAQYRLGHITFSSNKEFNSLRLRAAVPMKDGDIFSVEGMRAGLKNMRDLYCARGYINFTPVPNTGIDEEHKLINVNFDMDEGAQYRIGKLVLNGEEPYAGAGHEMLVAWDKHEGEVYSCNSLKALIESDSSIDPRLGPTLQNARLDSRIDNSSHTVNVFFDFPDPPANARVTPSPH